MAILKNILSTAPINCNVGYVNSWLEVENDANRELFAQAAYVTNFSDMPIQLSAADVQIGGVEIKDWDSDLRADVTTSDGLNALRVLSQDLESSVDDITIGDKQGNLATVKQSTSSLNVNATYIPPISYALDSGSIDAFGRLRASMPTTLFDSKTLHNKSSLFWSQTAVGTGSDVRFTSELNDASVTLSAANIGAYAIRQTTQRFNYQPGKSQLAIFTGILNPVSNAIKRYGLFQSLTSAPFDPNVGLYFETQTDSASSIAVVQQNNNFLVPSVSARRENWNIDKLDGTGPSGKVLTLSAANIFLVDYEWLGVGRVRFGTVLDGQICYCHSINNAGNVQGAYIRTPNLPVRAEIRQTGAGTSSMKIICCSVMSEGGSDFTGLTRAVNTGDRALTIGAASRKAILGVRLNAVKLDSVNEVINASIICTTGNNATQAAFRYELMHNPTLSAGGTWQSVDPNSNFDYWQGTVDVIDKGTVIACGYGSVGSSIDLANSKFEKFLRMGCSVAGKRDELYLVVTPLEANNGVYGAITFLESD